MHAGQETNMLRGAIWACAIPMGLGLWCLVSLLIHQTFPGPFHFSIFPISFFLVAPLSAWLACWRLRRIVDVKQLSRWRTSCFVGLASASLAQLIFAVIFTSVLSAIILIGGIRTTDWYYVIGNSIIYNVSFWFVITLPLSLICASVFWRITKFPEDRNVF